MEYIICQFKGWDIYVIASKKAIIMITTDKEKIKGLSLVFDDNVVLLEAKKQLEDYFMKRRQEFDLPLELNGTEFQKKVWRALMDIPYGETRSYKEIAKVVGNDKASRAIGLANNKNLIMIIIPCHRVIGSNGKLVGYAGGLNLKAALLELEGIID
jgi:O-6-methylguanine DNA methyltransferase